MLVVVACRSVVVHRRCLSSVSSLSVSSSSIVVGIDVSVLVFVRELLLLFLHRKSFIKVHAPVDAMLLIYNDIVFVWRHSFGDLYIIAIGRVILVVA